MAQQVRFHITAGLPFGKTIVVALPSDRDWWTGVDDFEVLAQIREAKDYTSPLLLDLNEFITVDFDEEDTVTIDLELKGKDTRILLDSGYYDVIISDAFTDDGRAMTVLEGPVYRDAVVTAAVPQTNL